MLVRAKGSAPRDAVERYPPPQEAQLVELREAGAHPSGVVAPTRVRMLA